LFGNKEFGRQQGYPTPTDTPAGFTTLSVNVPDNAAWWAIYIGLLESLTDPRAWQQLEGGISREDAADIALEIFIEAVECAEQTGGCMDCCGEIPSYARLPDGEVDIVDGVPLLSLDGGTTFMPVPPDSGAALAPQRLVATGVNDRAKRCNSALRATNVISELYRQTFGAITANVVNTLQDVNHFLWDLNQVLINLTYGKYTGILKAGGFFGDFPYTTHWTAPDLDGTAQDELRCLLFDSASVDPSGIVTFDFINVRDAVGTVLGVNPGTAVALLLDYIGEAGLNRAGDVGDATGNCDDCSEEWCYLLDFEAGTEGYAAVIAFCSNPYATHSGVGWTGVHDVCSDGSNITQTVIGRTLGAAADFTAMELEYTADASTETYFFGTDEHSTGLPAGSHETFIWEGSRSTANIGILIQHNGNDPALVIHKVTFRGIGDNPFGEDNCE